ncbi:MAG: hypothetical protein CMJ31_03315 [Phycisphaerae bacterium]|nr:hypothetical protein [Phycisphaerae bacterium]|tara:strand:- start:282 stop:695 length:414 start_codon:yes stop_codon:yes gene_type:complete
MSHQTLISGKRLLRVREIPRDKLRELAIEHATDEHVSRTSPDGRTPGTAEHIAALLVIAVGFLALLVGGAAAIVVLGGSLWGVGMALAYGLLLLALTAPVLLAEFARFEEHAHARHQAQLAVAPPRGTVDGVELREI